MQTMNGTRAGRLGSLVGGAAALVTLTALAPAAMAQVYHPDGPEIVTQGSSMGPGGYYVVQPDDTLWDLCGVFFNDPWFWPTLWSFNPQITNPHWIYPGDTLLMRAPASISGKRTIVWSESRYSNAKVDLRIFSRYVGYLPDRKFKHSGKIMYARESHKTLGEYDEIYVAFQDDITVKRGERFTIYRNEGPVYHPKTGALVGQKVRHLGVAKVLDASKGYVKALILKSYQEIYRGDLLTSAFPHSFDVAPKTNDSDVVATLVDFDAPVVFGGQFEYVYLDKGRVHGLRRGNRFLIERRGDGAWIEGQEDTEEGELDKFPWERLGEVMVVEVFEDTALGIVTRTISELKRGDRLVMQKGY